jgi:putative protease
MRIRRKKQRLRKKQKLKQRQPNSLSVNYKIKKGRVFDPAFFIYGCFFTVKEVINCEQNTNGGLIMAEKKIGEVMKFFSKPSVAAVKIMEGEVTVGDSIKFSGHTTDFIDVIESMEVDNKSVQKAVAGDFIGVKVSDRVRPGDEVFKVIPD